MGDKEFLRSPYANVIPIPLRHNQVSHRIVNDIMLTHERLTSLLSYDPETGAFTWLPRAGGKLAGRRAGCARSNCFGIAVDKKIYPASRLAWLYTHGEFPLTPLRFNDGDSTNVAMSNLRLSKSNADRAAEKRVGVIARKQRRDEVFGWQDTNQARLHELFTYNPETGHFFWRESGKGRTLNRPAGSLDTGHLFIRVDGVSHGAQRLAWIYVHGAIPEGQRIRFEDGNPLNCQLANLRLARTKAEHYDRFHERNPHAARGYHLSRYDGMTIADYNAMFAAQDGVCAICKNPETQVRHGIPRLMSVDHCHDDGTVRGLLCSRCNTSVGFAKNSPEALEAAAEYLRSHATKKVAA